VAAEAAARAALEEALFVMLGDPSPAVARAAAEFWGGALPRAPGARLAELLERAARVGEGARARARAREGQRLFVARRLPRAVQKQGARKAAAARAHYKHGTQLLNPKPLAL
jgi:hypothetical protein